MQPLQLIVTQAGLDALVNAQEGGADTIRIEAVGLTETGFTPAPTIDALPGEFKRLDTVSGQSTSETIIHMTAIDATQDAFELRGFGLYLADGTLFAVYAQEDPLFRKVAATTMLFVQDIAFGSPVAGSIEFGDVLFLNPAASETVKGVAEIATPQEAATGTDHERIITPLTLAQRLAALSAALTAAIGAAIADLAAETDADLAALSDGFDAIIAALVARTITGGGLVSGGGNLSASRVLTVLAASATDVGNGSATDRAITPAALSGLPRLLAQNGYAYLPGLGGLILQWGRFSASPNATSSALFPISFPGECFGVVSDGGVSGGADSQDNPPVLVASSISQTGFSVFSADDSSATRIFFALGV
ncbi:hypothetical protein [Sphingobium sp.]|uniref:gp53-like domain-containing protein n=1 Tax=Sphingobium sp. TaxID=1912891 RepID=UPI000DB67C4E|nr:hypothetical protein [Sphingobium sp.]PZU67513.1 MAG: hypothetical protein DI540_10445 [Sphingobium sp.]